MRILIVDDSKAMRLIVVRTLRQSGLGDHVLEEATNGKEALEAIRKNPPDLVLSDWNMPEMTGIELLEQLRAEGIKTRFAFVTSESTPEMTSRGMNAGALAFVTKPFTVETFREKLAAAFQ